MLSTFVVMFVLTTPLFMSTNPWRWSVQGTPCSLSLIVAIKAIMGEVGKSSFRDFKGVLTLSKFTCSVKNFINQIVIRIQTVICSMLYILCLASSIINSVEELNNSALVVWCMTCNKCSFQTSGKQIRSEIFQYTNILLPRAQFVLLELATHLVYAPLHSTHPPRPKGEYTWRVCCLLDGPL